jgi:hypothetical protein
VFNISNGWGGIIETGKDMIQLSTLAEQYIAQVGGSKFRHADDPAIAKYGYASVRSISVGEKMPIIFRNSFYNHDLNQAESKELQLKIKKQAMSTTSQGTLRIATLPSR